MIYAAKVVKVREFAEIWIALIIVAVLVIPATFGTEHVGQMHFKVMEKVHLSLAGLAFDDRDNKIFGISENNLYVLSPQMKVEKKITLSNATYGPTGKGIAFNPATNKIYISMWPNKIMVLNAKNYSIIKKIELDSICVDPNLGAATPYIDVQRNMIYVKTGSGTESRFISINGKNDSLGKEYPFGALNFNKNELWVWNSSASHYNINIYSLSSGKLIKTIQTSISVNNSYILRFSGDRAFVEYYCDDDNIITEYNTTAYSIVQSWNTTKFIAPPGSMGIAGYDSGNHIAYAIYTMPLQNNASLHQEGMMAINADNGEILARETNITVNKEYEINKFGYLLGIDPATHNLYVGIFQPHSMMPPTVSTDIIVYSLESSESSGTPDELALFVAAAIIVAVITGAMLLWSHRQRK